MRNRVSLLVVSYVLLGMILVGCTGPMTFVVGMTPGDKTLKTQVVEKEAGSSGQQVAIIDVTGMIMNAPKRSLLSEGEHPISLLREKLDYAAKDPQVRAVILRLNTPGGGVTASDAMYREVIRFKARTGKPVVALMTDVAASGGYYLACATDEIVAYPTTVTGSIGVIFQTVSLKPALTRFGVQTDAITSGPHKGAGSPLAVMTPEQRQVMQVMVDDYYKHFVDVVKKGRPNLSEGNITMATDGRVFSGDQAVEIGLVDKIGDLQTAYESAKQRAGISRADLVMFKRPLSYIGSPYAQANLSGGSPQVNMAQFNVGGNMGGLGLPTGFYYLWMPSLK
ncbi:signal peptide peptidase SppA [Poriferisphaera sp. WC338]|uniref:signal peptide peptidase SppA n=1 Tax=Poriferisphaera sp. WC338 TaxID=3425129 RepID=UPI003D816686